MLAKQHRMDYSKKTRVELLALCKEKCIKGYSSKKKEDLVKLLTEVASESAAAPVTPTAISASTLRQEVLHGDALAILPTLPDNSAQIVLADPPYNIGKDFGNTSDKRPMEEYLNNVS